nr:alpha/beta hydrolase [Hydrogenophaga crassostreae]
MKSAQRPDPAWLESQYNNRALVPDHAQYFERWAAQSKAARTKLDGLIDVAYGHAAGETLDIFPAQREPGDSLAPVLVFIHGGYWRGLDKSDHSFLAPAFVKQGACVVVPNYALCPAVTIPDITMQMVKALAWVYRHIAVHGGDPDRITIVGHSAGGHLAAMLMACDWPAYASDLPDALAQNALSISGLYDLEPLRSVAFLKDDLKLTARDARRASPALMPTPPVWEEGWGCLHSVAGGDESEEFLRQNRLIQEAWGRDAVPSSDVLPGLNHFSVLDALNKPSHGLHQRVLQLLA